MKNRQIFIGLFVSLIFIYLVIFKPQFSALFSGEMSFGKAFFGTTRIALSDFKHAFSMIKPVPAIIAAIMLALTLFLRAWRWQRMIKQVGSASYWSVFHSVNLGYLINNVLPMRAGEIMRAIIVGRKNSLSISSMLTTVFLERVFDVGGLVIVFGATLAAFTFPEWVRVGGATLAVFVLLALAILIIASRQSEKASTWIKRITTGKGKFLTKFGEISVSLLEGLGVLKRPADLWFMIWTTIALYAAYVFVMQLVMVSFGFTDGTYPLASGSVWVPGAAITVTTSFGLAVPSAPGGIGTYHAAALAGLNLFDIPEGLGVVFATFVHALMIAILNLMGIISLFGMGMSWKDLMKQVKENA